MVALLRTCAVFFRLPLAIGDQTPGSRERLSMAARPQRSDRAVHRELGCSVEAFDGDRPQESDDRLSGPSIEDICIPSCKSADSKYLRAQ
jgi:hypothetical protein